MFPNWKSWLGFWGIVLAIAVFWVGIFACVDAVANEARTEKLRAVMTAHLGVPCQGEYITIRRNSNLARETAWAPHKFPTEADRDRPWTYTECSIEFGRGHFSDKAFCEIGAHEWKHLLGHRPKSPFVNFFTGKVDRYHSSNRRSMMHPQYLPDDRTPYKPCVGF